MAFYESKKVYNEGTEITDCIRFGYYYRNDVAKQNDYYYSVLFSPICKIEPNSYKKMVSSIRVDIINYSIEENNKKNLYLLFCVGENTLPIYYTVARQFFISYVPWEKLDDTVEIDNCKMYINKKNLIPVEEKNLYNILRFIRRFKKHQVLINGFNPRIYGRETITIYIQDAKGKKQHILPRQSYFGLKPILIYPNSYSCYRELKFIQNYSCSVYNAKDFSLLKDSLYNTLVQKYTKIGNLTPEELHILRTEIY